VITSDWTVPPGGEGTGGPEVITACGRRQRLEPSDGQAARVPVPPMRPPELRGRVFRGTWAVGAGLLTEQQLRSRAWRRLRRDVFADADLTVDHRLLARGVSLVMPRAAALGGCTAAVLWGVSELVSAADPVEVVVPPGTRWTPGPGVRVRSAPLVGDVVGRGPWLRWTGRVRTAVDLIRRDAGDESVVLLDRLVAARMVDLADVRAAVAVLPRCRGAAAARRTARLADGLAESPPETRLRLVLHRSGLPLPVAQFEVRVDGRFVARVDFAWPDRQVAVEYDGAWHGDPDQLPKDRRRLNRLAAAGWRVHFVTKADTRRPDQLLAGVAAALRG
jgi:G:T-mismatch repair DNA endonuclease (very short patch repair protein)